MTNSPSKLLNSESAFFKEKPLPPINQTLDQGYIPNMDDLPLSWLLAFAERDTREQPAIHHLIVRALHRLEWIKEEVEKSEKAMQIRIQREGIILHTPLHPIPNDPWPAPSKDEQLTYLHRLTNEELLNPLPHITVEFNDCDETANNKPSDENNPTLWRMDVTIIDPGCDDPDGSDEEPICHSRCTLLPVNCPQDIKDLFINELQKRLDLTVLYNGDLRSEVEKATWWTIDDLKTLQCEYEKPFFPTPQANKITNENLPLRLKILQTIEKTLVKNEQDEEFAEMYNPKNSTIFLPQNSLSNLKNIMTIVHDGFVTLADGRQSKSEESLKQMINDLHHNINELQEVAAALQEIQG